jgi:7-keto-8-aminopelargonate synthetase-like enzyme
VFTYLLIDEAHALGVFGENEEALFQILGLQRQFLCLTK